MRLYLELAVGMLRDRSSELIVGMLRGWSSELLVGMVGAAVVCQSSE